jgi:sulfide:quinone oxidoreductase
MANILVVGGGFAGVTAAEGLKRRLGDQHHVTLISKYPEFIFYPALVRLAFGRCDLDDVLFDLRQAMVDRGIEFVQSDVLYPDIVNRQIVLPLGRREIKKPYDHLVFAPGRRLAAESIEGFSKYAHHLLTVGAALKFGEAVKKLHQGHVVLGWCGGARLAVPVYETAFALDCLLRERGDRDRIKITIVAPESIGEQLGGYEIAPALRAALEDHDIEFRPDFAVTRITEREVWTADERGLAYNLLMLFPPFEGPHEGKCAGLADDDGYIPVNDRMRALNCERVYAIGDCVDYPGPKMAHLAVLQAEVAAANLAAEIEGRAPVESYDHDLMLVIDGQGKDSLYFHKNLLDDTHVSVRQGHFWSWAKEICEAVWRRAHL